MLNLNKTKNVENPTCVLDSAEEHLLTLCRPRIGENQITGRVANLDKALLVLNYFTHLFFSLNMADESLWAISTWSATVGWCLAL